MHLVLKSEIILFGSRDVLQVYTDIKHSELDFVPALSALFVPGICRYACVVKDTGLAG